MQLTGRKRWITFIKNFGLVIEGSYEIGLSSKYKLRSYIE